MKLFFRLLMVRGLVDFTPPTFSTSPLLLLNLSPPTFSTPLLSSSSTSLLLSSPQ
jgi:hypothetical protein